MRILKEKNIKNIKNIKNQFINETLDLLRERGVIFYDEIHLTEWDELANGAWDKASVIYDIETQIGSKGAMSYETRLPNGNLFLHEDDGKTALMYGEV